MDKGKAIELVEKYKAVFVRITGNGVNIKVSESTHEETASELDSLWETLPPGNNYTIEFRSNKNTSVDNPKFKFSIPGAGVSGIGNAGTGLTALEQIGGPNAWTLMEENRELKAKIERMESDKKMEKVLRDMEELKRKKKDDGSGPDKFLGMVSGLMDMVNKHNAAKATASGAGVPVSSPARSLSGPPDAERTDEPAGLDEVSEQLGAALEPIIEALGMDTFMEIITAMGEKAKLDPDGFKTKLESMKAFL